MKLILVARRADRLSQLKDQLESIIACHIVVCNVNDQVRLPEQLSELPAAFSEVDVLVNRAGLALGLGIAQASGRKSYNRES